MTVSTEAEVVAAFVSWLEADGWAVETEVAWADVVAERGSERLIAEAKGSTTSSGLDIDTLYGQLLRRIIPDANVRYAVVLPASLVAKAVRVHESVRALLKVEVYGVDADGTVAAA